MDKNNINTEEIINKGKELTDAAYQKSLEVIERTKIRFKLQEARTVRDVRMLNLVKLLSSLLNPERSNLTKK